MRAIFLLVVVSLTLIGNYSIAQQKAIDSRFKGKEPGLRKFIAKNINYPAESLGSKNNWLFDYRNYHSDVRKMQN